MNFCSSPNSESNHPIKNAYLWTWITYLI
jgi:hypothetical protein